MKATFSNIIDDGSGQLKDLVFDVSDDAVDCIASTAMDEQRFSYTAALKHLATLEGISITPQSDSDTPETSEVKFWSALEQAEAIANSREVVNMALLTGAVEGLKGVGQ